MKNKLLLAALLTAFSWSPASAGAETAVNPHSQFSGIYGGAQGGLEITRLEQNYSDNLGVSFKGKKSITNISGGPLFGYIFNFDEIFFCGLEAYANFFGGEARKVQQLSAANGGNKLTLDARRKYAVGAALLGGVNFANCWSAYVRLGVENAGVEQKFDEFDPATGTTDFRTTDCTNVWGFAPGLGLQKSFKTEWGNVITRLDYTYVTYQNAKIRKSLGDVVGTRKTDPSAHSIRFGLIFNCV